jgi:hypothetical protein
MTYDFRAIEARWQRFWDEHQTFRAEVDPERPKYYVLDMFPYPSGDGLHVGHPEGYTATDIVARYKRMRGFNVLHPMGWDAFGLPAERYAMKTGVHPAVRTAECIRNFKRQLKTLGFSYDWAREVDTTDPATTSGRSGSSCRSGAPGTTPSRVGRGRSTSSRSPPRSAPRASRPCGATATSDASPTCTTRPSTGARRCAWCWPTRRSRSRSSSATRSCAGRCASG